MSDIEVFFDVSSPWTRIAFHNLRALSEDVGASILWRPFLVGGVFNAVNDSMYAARQHPDAPKVRHTNRWLREWADVAGISMNFPAPFHPLKSVLPMRVCCSLEADQPKLVSFASACFDAYFGDQRNLDDPAVLAEIASSCGFDGASLVARASDPDVKASLRANTDEAIARGAFGSPTIYVGDLQYFGNDQLPLIRQALASCRPQ